MFGSFALTIKHSLVNVSFDVLLLKNNLIVVFKKLLNGYQLYTHSEAACPESIFYMCNNFAPSPLHERKKLEFSSCLTHIILNTPSYHIVTLYALC